VSLTPQAAASMRADTTRVLAEADARMLKVLTRLAPEPIPVGEASDSDWSAFEAEPLRRHSEEPLP
jgi:hypothetical protein